MIAGACAKADRGALPRYKNRLPVRCRHRDGSPPRLPDGRIACSVCLHHPAVGRCLCLRPICAADACVEQHQNECPTYQEELQRVRRKAKRLVRERLRMRQGRVEDFGRMRPLADYLNPPREA